MRRVGIALLLAFGGCTGEIFSGSPHADDGGIALRDGGAGDAGPSAGDAATTDAEPFEPPPGAHLSARVYPGGDSHLVYAPDELGNTIPDFSYAGYRGGGVALPSIAGAVTVEPGDGDDRARIQAAIDQVAAREPDGDGFRGAVVLAAGSYQVGDTLTIGASGVVLRGAGAGEDGTVITATAARQYTLIEVDGGGSADEIEDTRGEITDDYVPFGARSFHVAEPGGFAVGDPVVVYRPSTANWIADLGMDQIEDDGDVVQWAAGAYDLHYQRQVVAVDGDRITVDAPVVNALQAEYGGGALYRFRFDDRIARVGIEGLRLVSSYQAGAEDSDEDHGWIAVSLDRVEDGWVRDVTALHFGYAAVSVERNARRITVQDCQCLDPVSEITGGRRYSFNVNGSLVLVQRCTTRGGRHDYVTGSRVLGPNVFLDSTATETHADIGPHHRWATGLLFDNITGGEMNVQDRGNWGTGHGWSGAQVVFWNSSGDSLACQRPPTADNFSIGFRGDHVGGRLEREDGYWEWNGDQVFPRSLYLWQLRDRLGPAAVEAVTTPAQRAGM